MRWIENPAACGLRFVGYADSLDLSMLRHTGHYADNGQHDMVRGVVFQMAGRDGKPRFLVGYDDADNGKADSNGPAHDTRDSDWSAKPLRRDYQRTFSTIETVAELKATIRNGGYAWPGGYQMHFVTHDGAALSFEAVRQNSRTVADSIRGDHSDGWRVVACDVNWEDDGLTCEHSGEAIPSAYGET